MGVSIKDKKYGKQSIVPVVGELFIDKLCMTVDYPASDYPKIIGAFKKAKIDKLAGWFPSTTYKHGIKLLPEEQENGVILQCTPFANTKATSKFLRIEFNPDHVDLATLKSHLKVILPGGYGHIMAKGGITRIDLTVDVNYIDAHDVLVTSLNPKVKTDSLFSKNGHVETRYVGSMESDTFFRLYDKPAEIEKTNKKKEVKVKLPEHKILRIEYCNTKCKSFQDVLALPNPFLQLDVAVHHQHKPYKSDHPMWPLFLTACRFQGIKRALGYLSKSDAEQFIEKLAKGGLRNWWMPEKIWMGLPEAIQKIVTI
ncbi:MAG: hypothetical protein PHN92_02175 [Geobacter sp.]|nr:hypothetical protein [Geobacter sp.]